jgi:hypothetical protein
VAYAWRRGSHLNDTDPVPGQGGYTQGTGPTNEYGFTGSGPAAPFSHGQAPTDVQHQQETVGGDQERHNYLPHDNWTGQVLRRIATTQPRSHDTEVRGTITVSADVPGAQNERNTVCYNRFANSDGVNRYTYGGEEGGPYQGQGVDPEYGDLDPARVYPNRERGGHSTPVFNRRMPYGGRNAGLLGGARGSQNSGWRFKMASDYGQFGGWQTGEYGNVRASGPRHRPTVFAEPAPWTQTYYDTSSSVGSPGTPGTGGQQQAQVYVSPDPAYQNPRGSWRRGG